VFVGAERAFIEPQHIAAFIVKGNRLQSGSDQRLLQGFANRGL